MSETLKQKKRDSLMEDINAVIETFNNDKSSDQKSALEEVDKLVGEVLNIYPFDLEATSIKMELAMTRGNFEKVVQIGLAITEDKKTDYEIEQVQKSSIPDEEKKKEIQKILMNAGNYTKEEQEDLDNINKMIDIAISNERAKQKPKKK